MDRKKTLGFAALFIVAVIAADYLQNGREMSVYNSRSLTAGAIKQEHLIVVVNRLYIPDKMDCAREIVRKCRENDFSNIRFSYDYGIPNELHAAIYLSEHDVKRGKPVFTLSYTVKGGTLTDYNIVDNPQEFELVIE
ncbi:hypothetical protein [Blautia producta]|uniref:Uncharacterized protein n=2 Tax=Blautia producta TaxID=33035 RepID=A0A7G5MXW9_9FIRM|nr:hypothetical protein [Blautia producta]QIB54950.1 hypothetical protein GXM18_08720 [Blautia producta ATCC 27340 = DSM 2950]QMW79462.1 hypothetical protein E5259_18645 [Blautia producta]HDF2668435.1 hypothetical protein [Clostridioides difficile]